MRAFQRLIMPALVGALLCPLAQAQRSAASRPVAASTLVAASGTRAAGAGANDEAEFERRAQLSRELGATHMLVTEGLPLATWQIDPDDPYPMWFAHHAGLLTIFPPKEVAPFVNSRYTADVAAVLQKRCAILAKYSLKGVWSANEPAVLPEAFFTAHPELRGPRIDQPNRSRKVYFAPSVDEPETLRLYRESIQSLLKTCPQIEQINWLTTDAGSGFDWAPSLYAGMNGNSKYKTRSMADRVAGFLINAQQAARAAGHDIQISLRPIEARPWMIPTFSPDVLRQTVQELPAGLAVEGREGPDGHAFSGVATVRTNSSAFYPVVGLVVPNIGGGSLWPTAPANGAPAKVMINFGDSASTDQSYRLFKFAHNVPMRTLAEQVAGLRAFAVTEVGEQRADDLLEVWSALNDVQLHLQDLNFGDVLRMGHVLNRWLTRPMVPFPEELNETEKRDYRRFLFQAKGEEQAGDLVDIQAMRMYEGWGAHMLFQRTLEVTLPRAQRALQLVERIGSSEKDSAAQDRWKLMGLRLEALICLLQSADNMVAYQAQLDRVKRLELLIESNPVLGVQSTWDRTDMMETARREIDNMIALEHILETANGPIFDLAPDAAGETIMRLGPDVPVQLRHKVATMNAHWRDYDRLFTKPNP